MDKQARLALAEHVVYCRRSDKLNIPFVGSIMNLVSGARFSLPKVHFGIVKYGDNVNSITVDKWIYTGKSLYSAYNTKQVLLITIRMVLIRFCHHLSRTVNFLFTEDLIIICASRKFIFANRTVLY